MVESHVENIWLFMVIGFTFVGLCGFAILEAGISRKIHGSVVLVKNLLQISVGITAFWTLGYGFAMGDVDDGFIGNQNFGGDDFQGTLRYIKCTLFGLFGMLAVFTINGSISERSQYLVYHWMTAFVMGWIYPVIIAWTWGGGWLSNFDIPTVDQGGAGPIHILGGIIGLYGTKLLEPRIGKFQEEKKVIHLYERDVTVKVKREDFNWGNPFLATIGGLFIWLGLSFVNAALSPTMIIAGKALLNSIVSASFSCLVALLIRAAVTKKMFSYFSAITFGVISGIVSVSAGCQNIEPWEAMIIGSIGSCLYSGSSWLFRQKWIDDPNEAISSQFVCGIWSYIAVAFFDNTDGVFHKGSGEIIGTQLLGLASVLCWATFFGIFIFAPFSLLDSLKINENIAIIGLKNAKISLRGFVLSEKAVAGNYDAVVQDEWSDDSEDED